jgi:hypothetical protein
MSTTLTREKAVKPQATHAAPQPPRPTIVTRAETAACTCPEQCERDHDDE